MNGTTTDIPDEFSGIQESNGESSYDICKEDNKVVNNEDGAKKLSAMEELKKEGVLLWAKIRGYSYWPGIVTVDPMDAVTIQMNDQGGTGGTTPSNKRGAPRSRFKIHVHFLGYDNMRAWITDDNIIPYEGKSAYDNMANNCPKAKLKDYFPTKKYQRLFEKAVTTSEDIQKLTLKDRLKALGLVYVPIPDEDTNETAGATIANGEDKMSLKKSAAAKRKSTSKVVGDKNAKKSKLSHNNDKNVSVNSFIPKIPSGGGFFKSFRSPGPPPPIVQPPKPETQQPQKTSLDVFDFDDHDDNALTINLDFQKVDEKKPSSPLPSLNSTTKSEKTPASSKPLSKPSSSTVQKPNPKKSVPKTPSSAVKKPQPGKRKLGRPSKQTKSTTTKKPKNVQVRVENNYDDDAKEVLMKDLTSTSDLHGDEFGDEVDEEKVSLGSLVWGRMSGFPFWPCFITKSPTGAHQRVFGKRQQFHAQFFNWNNESGWVSSTLPWCSIEEYHKRAKIACPKGPNTIEGRTWYPPARLVARWKGAVFEAQKTSKLSRRTRYTNLVTSYTSEDITDTDEAGVNTTPKPRVMKKQAVVAPNSKSNKQPYHSRKKIAAKKNKTTTSLKKRPGPASLTGRPRFIVEAAGNSALENTSKRFKEKPCPASKKKEGVFINGLPIAKLELPTGWCYDLSDNDDKVLSLQSPEGITYDGISEAIKMLMQNNVGPSTRKRSYSCSSIGKKKPKNVESVHMLILAVFGNIYLYITYLRKFNFFEFHVYYTFLAPKKKNI